MIMEKPVRLLMRSSIELSETVPETNAISILDGILAEICIKIITQDEQRDTELPIWRLWPRLFNIVCLF